MHVLDRCHHRSCGGHGVAGAELIAVSVAHVAGDKDPTTGRGSGGHEPFQAVTPVGRDHADEADGPPQSVAVGDADAGGDVGVAKLASVVAAQPDHHVRDVELGLCPAHRVALPPVRSSPPFSSRNFASAASSKVEPVAMSRTLAYVSGPMQLASDLDVECGYASAACTRSGMSLDPGTGCRRTCCSAQPSTAKRAEMSVLVGAVRTCWCRSARPRHPPPSRCVYAPG